MTADLLPPNATPQERAITISGTQTRAPGGQVIANLWNPQTCPADLLPWLGFALSVEGWDTNWTEQQKRDAIAASVEVHRVKGTVGAVKRALQAIGYEVYINEETGQPYTFRLQVDISEKGASDPAIYDEAERIALATKNARSHLTGVDALGKVRGVASLMLAGISGEDTLVWPDVVQEIRIAPLLNVLTAEQTIDSATVYPDQTVEMNFNLNLAGGGGLAGTASYET